MHGISVQTDSIVPAHSPASCGHTSATLEGEPRTHSAEVLALGIPDLRRMPTASCTHIAICHPQMSSLSRRQVACTSNVQNCRCWPGKCHNYAGRGRGSVMHTGTSLMGKRGTKRCWGVSIRSGLLMAACTSWHAVSTRSGRRARASCADSCALHSPTGARNQCMGGGSRARGHPPTRGSAWTIKVHTWDVEVDSSRRQLWVGGGLVEGQGGNVPRTLHATHVGHGGRACGGGHGY